MLGQLAIAFLAFKATLRPATLLCAVGLCVCLQCCFFVAFCISTHRLSSLLQFAIAFSHCRLDHCASGSGAFGWVASPPLVIWKIRESVCSFIVLTMKCLFLLAFSFGVSSSCCLRIMSPRRSSFAPSSSASALIYASILSSTIRMLSSVDFTLCMCMGILVR